MNTDAVVPIPLRFSMAYYIRAGNGVLVDAGSPGEHERILEVLDREALPVPGLIYLTHSHFDHFGSAAALQEWTGALIAIHCDDAAPLAEGATPLGSARGRGRIVRALLPLAELLLKPEPAQADVLLEDGSRLDRLGVAASVLHTPGHTYGSSTLLLDSGEAFVGDLISATGSPHIQRYYAQDWEALHQSVRRLRECRPNCLYCGHGRAPVSSSELQDIL